MSTNYRRQEFQVKTRPSKSSSEPSQKKRPVLKVAPADSVAGDPVAKDRASGKDGSGVGQVVSCRLPAEEVRAFDALCGQMGIRSRSDGLRSIVRMASGFLEFSREDCGRLEEIRYALGKIGTNVNQIALAANRGRAPMVRAQWQAITELRRVLPMMQRELVAIISDRRRQGVRLFQGLGGDEDGRHG